MRVLVPLHPTNTWFNRVHSTVCVVVSPCGINLHHPKVNDFEHVHIYHLYIFTEVCSNLSSIKKNQVVIIEFFCCSVTQSCLTLWPHGLQHARLPCPSLSPRVCPNSCPLSQRCHPVISFSLTHFSSCPQSFPASGSFPVSQLFASGGQSIGASASASVLSMTIQYWFFLG